MKSKYIAFIRGINVGRAKRIAMAELRKIFEDLGFGGVKTLLNSGNVVFTSSGKSPNNFASQIEKAITSGTGISAKIIVLTADELNIIIKENPLLKITENPSRLLISIPENISDLKLIAPLKKNSWTPEVLDIGKRAAYIWCPNGVLDSRASAAVNKILGANVTTRNWATILKLQPLVDG